MTSKYHKTDKEIPRVRVLLFHRILPKVSDGDTLKIDISESSFQKQIELLDRWGYTAITFSDIALYLSGKLDLPKKPVILTFDDTNKNMFDYGYPLLQSFGMKAVIFLVTDNIMVQNVRDQGIRKEYEILGQQEVLEMHSAGFEIGSHTITHPRLTLVASKIAREEIERSRMIMEIFLNAPVKSFAYPFGLVNDEIKKLVKESGYLFACSSSSGQRDISRDLLEIRRIKVRNTTNSFIIYFQLHEIYSFYSWLRWTIGQNVLNIIKNMLRNKSANI